MDEDTVYDFNEDMTKTRERIYKDIKGLPEDFGTSHRRYLMDRSLVLSRMADSVHQEFSDKKEPKTLNGAFAKTITMWRTEYTQTETELRELIQSFGIDKKLLTRIEYEPESLEAMLTGFMDEKKRTGNSDDKLRLTSPLIRLLRTTADRHQRTIERNVELIEENWELVKRAVKELEGAAAVKFADPAPGSTSVEATSYESEVIITASPVSKRGMDTTITKVIVIGNPISEKTRFHLNGRLIQRQI